MEFTTVSELVKVLNDPNNKKTIENVETSGFLNSGLRFGQISGVAYGYSFLYEDSNKDSPFVSVRAKIINSGEYSMLYGSFYDAVTSRDFIKIKGSLIPQPYRIIDISDILVRYTREDVESLQRFMKNFTNSDIL